MCSHVLNIFPKKESIQGQYKVLTTFIKAFSWSDWGRLYQCCDSNSPFLLASLPLLNENCSAPIGDVWVITWRPNFHSMIISTLFYLWVAIRYNVYRWRGSIRYSLSVELSNICTASAFGYSEFSAPFWI